MFLIVDNVKAQQTIDNFLRNLVTVNRELYLSEDYKDRAFVFCIGMQIDKKGQVGQVTFSDKSQLFLGRLIDFPKIESKLKLEKNLFRDYKGKFLILPVFITRGDSKVAINLDEMELLWRGMIDDVKRGGDNPILLPPDFMRFKGETIN